MLLNNYVVYHLHTELSLQDSTTNYESYIEKAVELGQTSLAFTEHGNIFQWVAKKVACDKAGIKYIHGVECYLTEKLYWTDDETGDQTKIRDNYHTILLAKNLAGLREINALVSNSYDRHHFYYKPRITFSEFLALSDNVIKISACLASPLNRMPISHSLYERLVKKYDYLEVQAHDHPDQISYNAHLVELSQKYGKPLIAGTDTHSLNKYKAECRTIMQLAKHIEFADEDTFDLTYKTCDELIDMFKKQGVLSDDLIYEAINNTNVMADTCENWKLDTSFKYPPLYGDRDREVLLQRIEEGLQHKVEIGAVLPEQIDAFKSAVKEEMRVFDKIEMSGFMLFMSELVTYCKSNGIPVGFGRGSCGGSRVAYLTNIIDINPETWHTIFSRFANEDRKEIGDIDLDIAPDDRDKVYEYIINRFGQENSAYILAIGTVKAKGCIDEICRALSIKWDNKYLHDIKTLKAEISALKETDLSSSLISEKTALLEKYKEENTIISAQNPWNGKINLEIKDAISPIDEAAKTIDKPGTKKYRAAFLSNPMYKEVAEKYPEVFYYFEGILDVAISQSMHPAGIVASPITLRDNYGTLISDGKEILQIDMNCVHDAGLVKYDILGLKNIGIIKDAYKLIGKPYPQSHEIDWNDEAVWNDMLRSPAGIFQMESKFAFDCLSRFKPKNLFDMAHLNASTRPAGASYRDELYKRIPHKTPSPIIDEMLKNNLGYIIYQEDTIKFLQEICGLSGSEADNVRRAIGRKQKDRLEAAMPAILDGYCKKSPQPREVAEGEAKEFLQIIEDSANYQFNYSHAIGYSMIGYLCAYLRYYYPLEFITAFLNNADNEDDIKKGSDLARIYNVSIISPKFGLSKDKYDCDKERNVIAKGVASVKYMNAVVATELYDIAHIYKPQSFMSLLCLIRDHSSLNSRQRDILIKIGFFDDFGNIPELTKMSSLFVLLKDGGAKKISKDGLNPDLSQCISEFASDKNKNGSVSMSYTIIDMDGLLQKLEIIVRSLNIQDVDFKTKVLNQLEYMGYISVTTGLSEDRKKLLVIEVFPLKRNKDALPWAFALTTQSLGSGKTSRLTVRANLFHRRPIKQYDVINAISVEKDKKGYWYLLNYVPQIKV